MRLQKNQPGASLDPMYTDCKDGMYSDDMNNTVGRRNSWVACDMAAGNNSNREDGNQVHCAVVAVELADGQAVLMDATDALVETDGPADVTDALVDGKAVLTDVKVVLPDLLAGFVVLPVDLAADVMVADVVAVAVMVVVAEGGFELLGANRGST